MSPIDTLAAISSDGVSQTNVAIIRKLSDVERALYERLKREFHTLKDRVSLLIVNARNYQEWVRCVEESNKDGRGSMIEFNRLYMNYLSSSYSLREHLKTNVKRDFGRPSVQYEDYLLLPQRLESTCREYAFIQDFRNFVQHCDFPIGSVRKHSSLEGTIVSVTYSRQELLSVYRDWDKCKLAAWAESEIDLVEVSRKHQEAIASEFTSFIMKAYGKSLDEIEKVYSGWSAEAAKVHPYARAVMMSYPIETAAGAQFEVEYIERDLLKSLGISIKPKQV